MEERKELISLLCQNIPVDKPTQDYIAHKAECCTPAQLQEIIFSLVIQHSDELDDIETIIAKINGRKKCQIGFNIAGNHDGDKLDLIGTRKLSHTLEMSGEDQK